MLTSSKFQLCLSKQLLKTQKSWKNWKLCFKTQSISVFLDKTKVADFRWKMLTLAELKRCVTWRPTLNRVNARKTCNAYIDFGIFRLCFIVLICKYFCFVATNWYRQYYELQTSLMINFNWVLYMYCKSK